MVSKNLTATKEAAQYASMQNHATRYYVLTRKGERPIFDSDAEQVRSKLAFSVWYLEGSYINGQFSSVLESEEILLHRSLEQSK